MELQKIGRFLSCIAPTDEQIVETLSSAYSGLDEEPLRQLYSTAVQRLSQTSLDEPSVALAFRIAFPSTDLRSFSQSLSETKGVCLSPTIAVPDRLDMGPKRHTSLEIADSGGGVQKTASGNQTRRLRAKQSDEDDPSSECPVQSRQRSQQSHQKRNFCTREGNDSASTQTGAVDGGRGRRSSETNPGPSCSSEDSPVAPRSRCSGAPTTPGHLCDRSGDRNERTASPRGSTASKGSLEREETSQEKRRRRRRKGNSRKSRVTRSVKSPLVRQMPSSPRGAGCRTKRRPSSSARAAKRSEAREPKRDRGGGADSETASEGGAGSAPPQENSMSSRRSPETRPQRGPEKQLGDTQSPPENDARSRSPTQNGEDTGWICKGPVQARKKPRRRFTRLQEEALVYGVIKYGTSNWRTILQKGGFDGRESRELHDKYRNLQKYGHLPELEKAVHEQLQQGSSPLQRLRAANGAVGSRPEHPAGARVVYEPLVARNISGFRNGESAIAPAGRKHLRILSSSGDESDRSAMDVTKKVSPKNARPIGVDSDDTDVDDDTSAVDLLEMEQPIVSVGAESRVERSGSARPQVEEERARGKSPTEETDLQVTAGPQQIEERQNVVRHVTDRGASPPKTVASDSGLPYRVLPRDTLIDEDFPPCEAPRNMPEAFAENDDAPSGKRPQRNFFSRLEEEALVHGVILYGRGNWAVIKRAGLFGSRTVIQLSDKYRNLEKYDHLRRLKEAVEGKLASGENPLRKLRESYEG